MDWVPEAEVHRPGYSVTLVTNAGVKSRCTLIPLKSGRQLFNSISPELTRRCSQPDQSFQID